MHRSPAREAFWATSIALIACVFGGCGGKQVSIHGHTLQLGLTEYRIDPQNVRADAGELTIVVHNYGRRTHNLVVTSHGQNIGRTEPIWPGTTRRLVLTLPAGTYMMASTILNDRTLVEYGTLTLR